MMNFKKNNARFLKEKNGASKCHFQSDRILSYFVLERKNLFIITISGFVYNIGLLAGPWFEGTMTGCLVNILNHKNNFQDMLLLALSYILAIGIVQFSRYIKRLYVRHFSNNINRKMKLILYGNLVQKSRTALLAEGEGNVMTKAIQDVDDCAEGMRKFTTEIFDTGVAMIAYCIMLLYYDWRLALLCMIFPPISYFTAEKLKKIIQRLGATYKVQDGILNAAILDAGENGLTYRVYGRETAFKENYETKLKNYEHAAIKANIWSASMQPIYRIISMCSVIFILYFGQKNILGKGFSSWSIATFTTFLSCYVKLATKSSSAAKLFNAVQKAQVSWERIKPLMQSNVIPCDATQDTATQNKDAQIQLSVRNLSFSYPNGNMILKDISFSAKQGDVIGISGSVACGKSTLGKVFLREYPYAGDIYLNEKELRSLSEENLHQMIGYLGHDTELFNHTVKGNILLGKEENVTENVEYYLKAVCMYDEVLAMEDAENTLLGNGGLLLSGGQKQRLALARTICHKKPILILDDPFSALDPATEKEIFKNIRDMCKDSILIIFSHRIDIFPEMDQTFWMEDGKLRRM